MTAVAKGLKGDLEGSLSQRAPAARRRSKFLRKELLSRAQARRKPLRGRTCNCAVNPRGGGICPSKNILEPLARKRRE
jgi:hypothetical protein